MKKIFSGLILFILISLLTVGCGKTQPISKYDFCLDTICSVAIYDSDDEALLEESFKIIRNYEKMLSATVSGSDIYNINNSEGEKVEVADETAYLISKSVHISAITDGAFDITIYPVSLLWDFKSGKSAFPEEADLKEALSHVGYENIVIEGNSVTLKDPDAKLELGAIAKGYIADKVCEMLKSRGVTSALINLGGNVAAIGTLPDGRDFKVGVKKPFDAENNVIKVLGIKDAAVATSGIDERYFEYNGEIYHHILDTKTGYPVNNGVSQVSVVSELAEDADVLSTVLFILGEDEGKKTLELDEFRGSEAFFIDR